MQISSSLFVTTLVIKMVLIIFYSFFSFCWQIMNLDKLMAFWLILIMILTFNFDIILTFAYTNFNKNVSIDSFFLNFFIICIKINK